MEAQPLSYEDILAMLRSNVGDGARFRNEAGPAPEAGVAGIPPIARTMETSQNPTELSSEPMSIDLTPGDSNAEGFNSSSTMPGNFTTDDSGNMICREVNLPGEKINVGLEQQAKRNATKQSMSSGSSGQLNSSEISRHQSNEDAGVAANAHPNSMVPGNNDSALAGDLGTNHASTLCSNRPNGNNETRNEVGSLVVPCRARGMPEDHNPRTAYFLVPPNIKHGTDLVCSHLECQDKGVKFCYCVYCKAPYAKRNFRQRHLHADEGIYDEMVETNTIIIQRPSSSAQVSNDPLLESENQTHRAPCGVLQTNVPLGENTERRGHNAKVASNKNSGEPSEAPARAILHGEQKKSVNTTNIESADSSTESLSESANPKRISSDSDSTSSQSKLIQSRRERWAALFDTRPANKSGHEMSAWLLDVLAVTDLSVPLSDNTVGDRRSSSSYESSSNSERKKMSDDSSSDDSPSTTSESANAVNVAKDKGSDSCNISTSNSSSSSDDGEAHARNGPTSEGHDTLSGTSRQRNVNTSNGQSFLTNASSTSTDCMNYSSTGSSSHTEKSSHTANEKLSSTHKSSASTKEQDTSGSSTKDFSSDSREGNDSDIRSNNSLHDGRCKSSNREFLYSDMTTENIIKSTHAKNSLKRGAMDEYTGKDVMKKARHKGSTQID